MSGGFQIEARDLVKCYGKKSPQVEALNLQALEIRPGERIGLVGNNGAGKTTLLRLILDLIPRTSGHLLLDGTDVCEDDSWKTGVGAFLDRKFLVDYLRPLEQLHFVGSAYGMSTGEIDDRIERFQEFLQPALDGGSLVRELSTGNASRIGIIAALLPSPRLIVLDEPYANLDPGARFQLESLLRQASVENGTTIIVSSHDLDHVVDVSTRILVLEAGRLIRDTPRTPETRGELRALFARVAGVPRQA